MAIKQVSISLVGLINNFIHYLLKRAYIVTLLVIFASAFVLERSQNKYYLAAQSGLVDYLSPVIGFVGSSVNDVIKVFSIFVGIFDAYDENLVLKDTISKLQIYSHLYEKVNSENKELKKMLKYVEKNPHHALSARILVNSNSLFSRSIIISAGQKDGVYKGQIVANDKGIIGRVVEVYDKTSRVMLIIDVSSRIPVISTKNRERAIIQGNSSSELILRYLRDDHKLEVGEMLISSGDGELIPYGIPVGIVSKTEQDTYIIKPFVNIDAVEYVSIINNN